jgi:4'-phosphopantetheinyl transferase
MTGGRVRVWLIPADLPQAVVAGFPELLDQGERSKLDAIIQAAERRRFLAAHGAARTILAGLAGMPPGELRFETGVNGKPRLAGGPPGLHVNLSHSGGLCLLAVAAREVGVDVQQVPPGLDPVAMAARRYPPAEAELVAGGGAGAAELFIRLWARKEACVKAAGGRLMQGLKLPAVGASPLRVAQPGGPLPGPFLVTDIPVPDGYHAAVAVNGDEPYDVVSSWWSADGAVATA